MRAIPDTLQFSDLIGTWDRQATEYSLSGLSTEYIVNLGNRGSDQFELTNWTSASMVPWKLKPNQGAMPLFGTPFRKVGECLWPLWALPLRD